MSRVKFTDAVMNRVADADFDIVMKSVSFWDTPRSVVTVGHMEDWYKRNERIRPSYEKGFNPKVRKTLYGVSTSGVFFEEGP